MICWPGALKQPCQAAKGPVGGHVHPLWCSSPAWPGEHPRATGRWPRGLSLIGHKELNSRGKPKGMKNSCKLLFCTAVKNLSRTTGWEDVANFKFLNLFSSIWKAEWEQARGREILWLLVYSFKYMQQPGLSQFEARSQELHLFLPRGWQGPRRLSCHLLPPRMH